jgi:hypothetical protein
LTLLRRRSPDDAEHSRSVIASPRRRVDNDRRDRGRNERCGRFQRANWPGPVSAPEQIRDDLVAADELDIVALSRDLLQARAEAGLREEDDPQVAGQPRPRLAQRGDLVGLELPRAILHRLHQIAQRIRPLSARIVINTIYDPSDGDNAVGRRELGLSRLATIELRRRLNAVNRGIKKLADEHGFLLADLELLFHGHGLGSSEPWFRPGNRAEPRRRDRDRRILVRAPERRDRMTRRRNGSVRPMRRSPPPRSVARETEFGPRRSTCGLDRSS